jgi:hypothetical protein
MLPGKIGTGSCEASCGSELQGSVEAVASKKTGSLTSYPRKRAARFPDGSKSKPGI